MLISAGFNLEAWNKLYEFLARLKSFIDFLFMSSLSVNFDFLSLDNKSSIDFIAETQARALKL